MTLSRGSIVPAAGLKRQLERFVTYTRVCSTSKRNSTMCSAGSKAEDPLGPDNRELDGAQHESDPGISLLQLFAHLAESLLTHLLQRSRALPVWQRLRARCD